MCFCELLLDSLENFSQKLTSQEYKDIVELLARQHNSCIVRKEFRLPDGGDRHHDDMVAYWIMIRDRSNEWIAYAEHNLRILDGDTPVKVSVGTQFKDILSFWQRIDTIRNTIKN